MGELNDCWLFLLLGSSANQLGAGIRSDLRIMHGQVPPTVRFIAADMPSKPRTIRGQNGSADFVFEPGREYIQLGRGLQPARVRAAYSELQDDPIGELSQRVAAAKRARSLETGAEADRGAGLLAGLWSRDEFLLRIKGTLHDLNDLSTSADNNVTLSLNIVVVAGEGGGTGSPNVLWAAGLVKEAMSNMGLSMDRSRFFSLTITPETMSLDEAAILANGFEFLREFAISQAEGLTPFSRDNTFGAPVDLAFRIGGQTSSGTLVQMDDVLKLGARALALLATTPLGQQSAERFSNIMPKLAARTKTGEPSFMATFGLSAWRFSGEEAAAGLALHSSGLLAAEWAELMPDLQEVIRVEKHLSEGLSFTDASSVMMHLSQEAAEAPLINSFEDEVMRHLGNERFTARLCERLARYEGTYSTVLKTTSETADIRASRLLTVWADAIIAEAARQADHYARAHAAVAILDAALARVKSATNELVEARLKLEQWHQERSGASDAAFIQLDRAVAASPTSLLRNVRGPLREYLRAATYRFANELDRINADSVVSALAAAEALIFQVWSTYGAHRDELSSLARNVELMLADLEQQGPSPVERLIDRPLEDERDRHALYERATGVQWDKLSDQMRVQAKSTLGGPSRLLALRGMPLAAAFGDAIIAAFESVKEMSIDDFVRWKCSRLGTEPELYLRDLESSAPYLCQVDPIRLRLAECQPSEIALIGVPDVNTSVFSRTSAGLLTSTGDATHITLLRFQMGFPVSAVNHFDRYREAHHKARTLGLGTQEILDDFPYEIADSWWPDGEKPEDVPEKPRRGRPRRNS